jgi:hypothetical protein
MTDIVNDLSSASLAVAVKANLHAFFQGMENSANVTVHKWPNGFRWRTNVAHPWFNGMLRTCKRITPHFETRTLYIE